MEEPLLEPLLAKVLKWNDEEVAQERLKLEAISQYKYDGYEQFSPGMRFIESLAMWLQQFHTIEERRTAYGFVVGRLVYISKDEMDHLVRTAYPDHMRALISADVAKQIGCKPYMVSKIAHSQEYRLLRRQSLFLGLSDGAKTDLLRRCNGDELTHEQMHHSHELSHARAAKMLAALATDIEHILARKPTYAECHFRHVFLLDDFTGSGKTYLRHDGGVPKGKLASVYAEAAMPGSPLSLLFDIKNARVHVTFYAATEMAARHIREGLDLLGSGASADIIVVDMLTDNCRVTEGRDSAFHALCSVPEYFDTTLDDEHTDVGGTSCRFGFSACSLPLVLAHNTPNNSVSILWSYESKTIKGLFPRVPRHVESTR